DLIAKITRALDTRTKLYRENVYRLLYGESDGVPGVIADRYNDTLVVQILTAGMDRRREDLIRALLEVVRPLRILLRNDSSYRELEGLPLQTEWVFGDPLASEIVEIDRLKYIVPYVSGQKTGFFLDQRRNRAH